MVAKTGRLATVLLMLLPVSTAPAEPTLTIFGNAMPETPVASDAGAVTLGVNFRSAYPGKVSGIRFYRGARDEQRWLRGQTLRRQRIAVGCGKGVESTCAVPCWEQVEFSEFTSASRCKHDLCATYYTSNGKYAMDSSGLTNGHSAGPLLAPASETVGGNGVYTYSTGFLNQS